MKAETSVSNHHTWESLHVIVQHGIHANTDPGAMTRSARCGCHIRNNGWWLCDYHNGMQDGVDLLMDELTTTAQEALAEMHREEEPA